MNAISDGRPEIGSKTIYDMSDFKQLMDRYGEELKAARCPYSEAELSREIRRAMWNTPLKAATKAPGRHSWWPAVAAAAIAAVIIPAVFLNGTRNTSGEVASVSVDGEEMLFACNNGCSPEGTLETFKTLLR